MNTSNLTHSSFWLVESQGTKVVKLSLMAGLAFVGVLGNILVFVVLLMRKPFRPTLRYFIFHLAISDTGFLVITLPIAVVMEQTLPIWTLGEVMCIIGAPVSDTFLGVAILSIMAIALDRYRCVAFYEVPFEKLAIFYKHGRKLLLFAIWLIAFFSFAFPWILIKRYENGTAKNGSQGGKCLAVWPDSNKADKNRASTTEKAYSIYVGATFFALPLLLISFTYWKISRHIRRSNELLRQNNRARTRAQEKRLAANTKAKKILTPLVVVFATTMFPLNAFRSLLAFYRPIFFINYYRILYTVCVFFIILNSSLDPIIYAVYSREFRRECKVVLSAFVPARVGHAIEMHRRPRRIQPVCHPPVLNNWSLFSLAVVRQIKLNSELCKVWKTTWGNRWISRLKYYASCQQLPQLGHYKETLRACNK